MENKIVIITFESYKQEAHAHSLETMEYIADNYHMIEEFKIIEMSGIIAKDESQVLVDKSALKNLIEMSENLKTDDPVFVTALFQFLENAKILIEA
tara:strand:- start:122 stop:409 length:288 start_codon:yes stop_codon:yes gene_type:complete